MPTVQITLNRAGVAAPVQLAAIASSDVIAAGLTIAAALPREFQRAFTPVERQQVIRIDFAQGGTQMPLFTKVKLRSGIVLPHWIQWIW